jgi:hypothetical protein
VTIDVDDATVKGDRDESKGRASDVRSNNKSQRRRQSSSPTPDRRAIRESRNPRRGAGRIEEIFAGSDRP